MGALDFFDQDVDLALLGSGGLAPVTDAERFRAEWENTRAPDRAFFNQARKYELWAEAADRYRRLTGETLPNPFTENEVFDDDGVLRGLIEIGQAIINPAGAGADRALTDARRRILIAENTEKLRAARELDPSIPDPETFDQQIKNEVESLKTRLADVRSRPQSTRADVLGVLGAIAGETINPIVLATLPLGAPVRGFGVVGNVLRTAGREAVIGAAAEVGVLAADLPTQIDLGTTPTVGDAIERLLFAAAGGAIFGGATRSAGEALRILRGRPDAPLELVDAHRVTERADLDARSNPYGSNGGHLHGDNMDAAATALREGRHPDPAQLRERQIELEIDTTPAGRVTPEQAPGTRGAVFTPAGRRIEVEYELVEADRLVASHGPDLTPNRAYPPEMQPRDRSRPISDDQVREIVARFQAERLGPSSEAGSGAPIVGPDNVVESGNGRTVAVQRIYEGAPDKAEAYRAFLRERGFDADGMEKPVLVARRVTGLTEPERVSFAREANDTATLTMGAAERAIGDADRLDGALPAFRGGDVTLAQNAEFVRRFLATLPAAERGALTTAKGELSQAGARRVEAALLQRAYGDADLVAKIAEARDNDIKAIGGALLDVAGDWAEMRRLADAGAIHPQMDATADLLQAVRTVETARGARRPVAEYVMQGDFVSDGLTPNGMAFLTSFYTAPNFGRPAGRQRIAERLRGYVEEARKTSADENLFGLEPPQPRDVLVATERQRMAVANLEAEEAAAVPRPADPARDTPEVEAARRLAEPEVRQVAAPDGPREFLGDADAVPPGVTLTDAQGVYFRAKIEKRGDANEAIVADIWVRDDQRRQGLASRFYRELDDALAAENRVLVPSGALKAAGFEVWRRFDPWAVRRDLRFWRDDLEPALRERFGADATVEFRDGGDTVTVIGADGTRHMGRDELVQEGVLPHELLIDGAAAAKLLAADPDWRPRVLYRGHGRADRLAAYNTATNPDGRPVLGEGRYYAFTRDQAQEFGPEVEAVRLRDVADSPMVIRSVDEYRALLDRAGGDPDRIPEVAAADGHDGVLVMWGERGDLDEAGRSVKRLRETFGDPQLVTYRGRAQEPMVPVGTRIDEDGNEVVEMMTAREALAAADRDVAEAVVARACAIGGTV